ncbi:MAG: aldolase/citrate lyase family protein [Clostridia bacterium]|nr:aldolase/citrate lyase family protein [Clostridia bacterium]
MALKLMYITNDCEIARIVEDAGVDRIFLDLETIGKQERQGGMDTVQSKHTFADICTVKQVLHRAALLVRSNPIHTGSEKELQKIIDCGAEIVMLPYFKTVEEVEKFLSYVNGRARTMLLFETPEAVEQVDEILQLDGIDEVFIGLNDLSLGYGKSFMFSLLADGTVERLCLKFRQKGIPYGFGGIAAIGTGTLPAEAILKEHYRLGSSSVILSRSFCNYEKVSDRREIKKIFDQGLKAMRSKEKEIEEYSRYFFENVSLVKEKIAQIADEMEARRREG